jgi:hypothetical protein
MLQNIVEQLTLVLTSRSVDYGDEDDTSVSCSKTFVGDDAVVERGRMSGCAATSAVSTPGCRVRDLRELLRTD